MRIPRALVFTVLVACKPDDEPPPCASGSGNDGFLGCAVAFVRDAGVDAPGTTAPDCPLCAAPDGTCPAGCEITPLA